MMPLEDSDTKVCGNTTLTSGEQKTSVALNYSKLWWVEFVYIMSISQIHGTGKFNYFDPIKINQMWVNILYMDPMGINEIFCNRHGTEIV